VGHHRLDRFGIGGGQLREIGGGCRDRVRRGEVLRAPVHAQIDEDRAPGLRIPRGGVTRLEAREHALGEGPPVSPGAEDAVEEEHPASRTSRPRGARTGQRDGGMKEVHVCLRTFRATVPSNI
jgi:hypothetical protein